MKKPKKNIKPIIKDKSGFTLVELLAVIVVLALLILIAGRAVFAQIEKSRKNTFRTEILTFGKAMEEYFNSESIAGGTGTFTVTIGTKDYEYACASPDDLKTKGFLDFSDAKTFEGRMQLFREAGTEDEVVFIAINDGRRYGYVNQSLSTIEAGTVDDIEKFSNSMLGTADVAACPTNETAFYGQVGVYPTEGTKINLVP
ncbi:MAG TPA: type II secretion system protein [Bacilli bacterium]|nr:type II secretion system protein [Bacilli bacterium]